jgi:hypothetical protein
VQGGQTTDARERLTKQMSCEGFHLGDAMQREQLNDILGYFFRGDVRTAGMGCLANKGQTSCKLPTRMYRLLHGCKTVS